MSLVPAPLRTRSRHERLRKGAGPPGSCWDIAKSLTQQTSDDAFAVMDSRRGMQLADDAPDDRTHQADISGFVRVTYRRSASEAAHKIDVPVCSRAPDERRRLVLQPIVLVDPGTGAGVVDETFVRQELFRARLAWQQACIEVQALPTRVEAAPSNAAGVNILADGWFDVSRDDLTLVAAYGQGASLDVVYVFFVSPFRNNDAWAFTTTPLKQTEGLGENTFVFFGSDVPHHYRGLAHELGHALDNGPTIDDAPFLPVSQFYPAGQGRSDEDVLTMRRLATPTVEQCRRERPAGDLRALGNRLLRPH